MGTLLANPVEHVEVVFGTSSSAQIIETDLTQGQDWEQCTEWHTLHHTGGNSGFGGHFVGVEFFDNAGTPAVRVYFNPTSSSVSVTVHLFVMEWIASVVVTQGNIDVTGTSNTDTIPSGAGKTRVPFISQERLANTSAVWNNSVFVVDFPTGTQIRFTRQSSSSSMDWTLYYQVADFPSGVGVSKLDDIHSFGNSETGPTSLALGGTIDLSESFIQSHYKLLSSSSLGRHGVMNVELTDVDEWTWYRDSGSTPGSTGDNYISAISAETDEFTVQRFQVVIPTLTTLDITIAAVDLNYAAIINSQHMVGFAPPIMGGSDANALSKFLVSLKFVDETTVRAEKKELESPVGTGVLRFEVVSFNEGVTPVLGGAMYHHLQNMGVYA